MPQKYRDYFGGMEQGELARSECRMVRWRGLVSFVTNGSENANHDPVVSRILATVDKSFGAYLIMEFADAYAMAVETERDLTTERLPDYCGGRTRRSFRAPRIATIFRSYRWYGQYAYARGIDRSPSHDLPVRRDLERHPNAITPLLIQAWERGWNEANEFAKQLTLDRKSILDQPPVRIHQISNPHRKPGESPR